MADLQEVDAWLDALLAGLEPAARKRMMRELAQQLRLNQQKISGCSATRTGRLTSRVA